MTYLKKFIGIKSLNTKQCPAGLHHRIISSPTVYTGLYPSSYQNAAKLSDFD